MRHELLLGLLPLLPLLLLLLPSAARGAHPPPPPLGLPLPSTPTPSSSADHCCSREAVLHDAGGGRPIHPSGHCSGTAAVVAAAAAADLQGGGGRWGVGWSYYCLSARGVLKGSGAQAFVGDAPAACEPEALQHGHRGRHNQEDEVRAAAASAVAVAVAVRPRSCSQRPSCHHRWGLSLPPSASSSQPVQ